MDVPIEISFRDMDPDPALADLVRAKTDKLERVCGRLTSLRVAVDGDDRHHTGQPRRVRLDVAVPPGREFVIRRETDDDRHKEAPVLVREAFEAARRKLRKVADKRRGHVKIHPEQQISALVARVFPDLGYGFLRNTDGRDVYFHRNALVGVEMEDLEPGMGVRHKQALGRDGLRATVVQVVDRRPG